MKHSLLFFIKERLLWVVLTLFTILSPSSGYAKAGENHTYDFEVFGRVIDAMTSEPLLACAIIIKGTNQGTTTDANGNYTLRVSDEKAVLVFSFIGYEKQEIALNGQKEIN